MNPYQTKYFVNYNDEIQKNVFIQSSDVVGVSDISGAPAHSLKQWFLVGSISTIGSKGITSSKYSSPPPDWPWSPLLYQDGVFLNPLQDAI